MCVCSVFEDLPQLPPTLYIMTFDDFQAWNLIMVTAMLLFILFI